MYIGLHVKYPLFLSYFNKILIFSTDFRKILKYLHKLHENPTRESRVVPCERTEVQTDMTKLIVFPRNFSNDPKSTTFW